MATTGFNHVSVAADDLEESVRFYEDIFAMERIPTYNFGIKTQYLRCGPQQLHVFELADAKAKYKHFALNVDDFQAVYDKAVAYGVLDANPFGSAVRELPDGAVQMYLRDPGGNLVEVNWPDVSTLNRSLLPEMKALADKHPQTGDNLRASLFPDRENNPVKA